MNPSNKVLASVAGVCITAAVVVGAVLGSHDTPRTSPAQHPAGNPAPIAATVTVTATARPAAVTSSRAASSKTKAAVHHRKQHRAAVVVPANQEPNVTDPTPTASTSSSPDGNVDMSTGTVDPGDGGVRRAPTPADPIRQPTRSVVIPPPAPSPT